MSLISRSSKYPDFIRCWAVILSFCLVSSEVWDIFYSLNLLLILLCLRYLGNNQKILGTKTSETLQMFCWEFRFFSHLDSSRHPRPAGAPPPSATTSSSSATSRGLTQRRPNSLRSPSSACKFRPPQTVLLPHSMRIKPQAFSPLQLPIPSISRDSVFRMHSMRAEGKLATPFDR